VRFTDFHVSPTCAPTRAALNSGRHEFRNGVTHTFGARAADAKATTSRVLHPACHGYLASGTWAMRRNTSPRRGFDEVFIHAPAVSAKPTRQLRRRAGQHLFQPAILHNGSS
jgi:arylsulfatase